MKSPTVSKLNVVLIATLVLTALPAAAKAAEPTAVLARGAGYATPNGSPRVELLQQRLRLVGVNPGPIDGRFGPLTEAAVRGYQLRDGLAVDGLAGPQTRTALRHAVKLVGRGAGYGMRHGSARVRKLQRSLRLAGARPGPIDGRFGTLTEAAVVRFQHSHGLAANGLAGEATMDALGRQVEHVASDASRRVQPTQIAAGSGDAKPAKVASGTGEARPATVASDAFAGKPAKVAGVSGHTQPAGSGEPARVPAPRVPDTPRPEGQDRAPGERALAAVELILFAAALLLAVAGIAGLPEKIARRVAGPPPPAPKRPPIVEDVDPDPKGKVVDGSRRPPRPRTPAHRLRPPEGGGATEDTTARRR
jgi:peptidoglycan hydrolase-like protein with peptidoglycan-binding domain